MESGTGLRRDRSTAVLCTRSWCCVASDTLQGSTTWNNREMTMDTRDKLTIAAAGMSAAAFILVESPSVRMIAIIVVAGLMRLLRMQ